MPIVLITGCSTGVGAAAARAFAGAGWTVVATLRDPAAAGELAQTPGVEVDRLDVTDPEAVKACVSRAEARHGGALDAVVNNAGFGALASFEGTPPETVERMVATNLLGAMAVTRAVLPGMRERREGVVVNVTSIGGLATMPFNSVYHATKFALDAFSDGLRYELAPLGVRVKVVAPGAIATPFNATAFGNGGEDPPAYAEAIGRVTDGFRRSGGVASSAETVAAAVLAAAQDRSPRLRHLVGADAEGLFAARTSLDETAYAERVASRFGLDLSPPARA